MPKKNIVNMYTSKPPKVPKTALGKAGYDNPRENIDPHIKTKVISTKEFNTAEGSVTNLKADHIAEKTTGHGIVVDNDVDLGANDLTIASAGFIANTRFFPSAGITYFDFNGRVRPASDDAYSLGSTLLDGGFLYRWKNLHLSGDANVGGSAIVNTSFGTISAGTNLLKLNGVTGIPIAKRGGHIQWDYANGDVTGYTFVNEGNQFVWSSSVQSTREDDGVAWVDFSTGEIHSDSRISTATATITASSDTTDVSGINTLFIDITGDIVLGGLTGGVNGQVLNIVILGNFVNHVTLEHAEGVSAQDFINHTAVDELMSHGGAIYVCNGSDWYDASHARHV